MSELQPMVGLAKAVGGVAKYTQCLRCLRNRNCCCGVVEDIGLCVKVLKPYGISRKGKNKLGDIAQHSSYGWSSLAFPALQR